MKPSVARNLIMSRLLALQSKRLVLASLERRVRTTDAGSIINRVETVRAELDGAHRSYRAAMLAHGVAGDPEYWLVAYGKLIDTAGDLVDRMRDRATTLPYDRRYEVAGEVEMLEGIVSRWRDAMRSTIATSGSAA